MNKNYIINEIFSAVDILLDNEEISKISKIKEKHL